MIHPACRKHFDEFVKAIMLRGEMDASALSVIERTGKDFDLVRMAINYAMNEQNLRVQASLKKLLECECPIYVEEWRERGGASPRRWSRT